MNGRIGRMSKWVLGTAVVVALAAGVGGAALADGQQTHERGEHGHPHGERHHGGLMQAALKLDTLSSEQRSQIEQLETARKTAEVPVMRANSVVLTQLAQQVESARIDRAGLKGSLDAETSAAEAARNVDVQTLAQLHGVLSAQQRNQLVDGIEARIPEGKPKPAQLEAFRGDGFDANAFVKVRVPGERAVAMAEKKVPGMSAEQRTHFAEHLRARASKQNAA
jgi:Spy/CpxP family protein refolding chaperone